MASGPQRPGLIGSVPTASGEWRTLAAVPLSIGKLLEHDTAKPWIHAAAAHRCSVPRRAVYSRSMARERPRLPGPRQPPFYFAGRTAEIDSLREALAMLCASGDASNGIELFTGVPGAGKTQLANEYARRVAGERHSGRTVHVVDLDTHLLTDEIGVFLTLAKALGEAAIGKAVSGLDTNTTGRTFGVARRSSRRHREPWDAAPGRCPSC